jgi:hypothetical protein
MSRQISGRLIAAARALTGIGQTEFAEAATLPVDALERMEAGGSAFIQNERDVEALSRALDLFGVVIVDEADGMGAGVRLKFTRQDVKQIVRWEGEGGIVGSDDAP